jgi:hypothetical protein
MLVTAFKPGYQLDPVEQKALVQALDQQCQTSPRFRKVIEKFLLAGGGVNLIGVVALIAVRRVARADLLPIPADSPISGANIDNLAGAFLTGLTQKSFNTLNVGATA